MICNECAVKSSELEYLIYTPSFLLVVLYRGPAFKIHQNSNNNQQRPLRSKNSQAKIHLISVNATKQEK
jgi:hypothetical protein